jgi:hypothetical protein
MTLCSFLPPNKTYVLVVAICSCVTLAGSLAEVILTIVRLTVFTFASSYQIYFQSMIVMSPPIFVLQLVWTVLAFKWYSLNIQPEARLGADAENDREALRNTVAQLSATVQALNARLEQQQPHAAQVTVAGYGATSSTPAI